MAAAACLRLAAPAVESVCRSKHIDGSGALERRFRVSDNERFRQVRQEGASYAHPLLILSCLRNDADVSRCGFTVTKRIGKAVERNRARRRIREAVRNLWDLVQPGWDLIWIARPGINEVSFAELQDACARLLRRARLLKE
jgi:ribonuclease P protein component